jgi:agmatine deiminase
MKLLVFAALLGVCSTAAFASAPNHAAVLSDAYLATIKDDSPSLPRGFTPEEKLIWRLPPALAIALAAPPQPVRAPAEYEGNDGLLMRWGSYNSVITEISVAVTRASARLGGPDPWVYLVVASSTQQDSAAQTLAAAGTTMARVRFIIAPSNSVWMRDYGPRFVNSAGIRGLIDHTYNRPRPLDDAMPSAVSSTFEAPTYALPLTHGGGNFHLFDDGQAYMTRLISAENPGLSEDQIKSYYRDYQGLEVTLTAPFPTSFDSTQHIDMWMLPAARRRVIISEYPTTGGVYTVPRQVTEDTTALMQARGYQVIRTPGWSNGAHYTYANAVVMNSKVLICRFGGEDARNAQALAAFQQAFPEREISTIDCSAIISAAGAIHCIVMHVSTPIIAINGFED